MMKNLKLALALVALSLGATALLPSNAAAAYAPAQTVYGAGSSGLFNTMALAAGVDNAWPGNSALCGEHHWTQSNGAELLDPRSSSILPEKGNIWIVWDDNAVNEVSGAGRVCVYVVVDSIVGMRAYFGANTIAMLSPAGTPDGQIVPLLGLGENLPTNIYNIVNGVTVNVGFSDIRPEDAKFGTIRALQTPAGSRIPRDSFTGFGYGPGPIGTTINSSQSSKQAHPVDFTVNGPDPITLANPRPYSDTPVSGGSEVVAINVTNSNPGHLGDGTFHNIDRYGLQGVFNGTYIHSRQFSNASGEPDVPFHVFVREVLSGTFNVFEFDAMLLKEMYNTYYGPGVYGQYTGFDPTNTSCTTKPCTVESGNPFWHIASNGSTRGGVVGNGEEIATLNATPDSIGYAFWGYSNFQGESNLRYLTVDGLDPLYASSSANPNGPGVFPQCTGSPVTSCPNLTFPNVVDGAYPIWNVQHAIWDPTDSTLVINALIAYSQHAAVSLNTDFVPATALTVFRSHFNQIVVTSNSDDQDPNNGLKSGVPETGGDMGGAVLTVQSELDYINDTGGSQQTNLFQ